MNKKIIALAVAAAFSAPAFADNANVTIYGKAFLTFDQFKTDKKDTTGQMRVNTNASRFGVKGSEDLGGGLKAIYQYEVEMDADGQGLDDANKVAKVGGFAKTRNSGVGIDSEFGKVMLGIWDTPFKVAHNKIELFDNTSNWSSTKTIGISETVDWNSRQKNMVQYWSPKFSDMQLAVMFSPDESQTPAVGTTKLAVNKSIFSMSGTFEQEDIYVSVAYESRNDVKATAAAASASNFNATNTAMRGVGKYSLGDFWVGAMLESIKTNTNSTTSVTGSNMEFVGGYKMGPHALSGSYAKAGSTSVAPVVANDVSQLSLKYAFHFSKRTEVFGAYASQKINAATAETKTYLGGGIVHSF